MKHKMKRMTRRSGIVCVLFMIAIFMAVWINGSSEYGQTAFDNEEVRTLTGSVDISCRGEDRESTLPTKIEAAAGNLIVITKKLNEADITENAVMFYAKQADTKVYLDEELIWQDPEWETPFPMLSGAYWRIVKIPSAYEGKTLRIEMIPEIDKYAGEIQPVYTGEKSALIYMVARQGIVFLLLGVIAFVLGGAILVVGLSMSRHGVIAARMYYLGLLSIVIGIWGSLEARATQLFTGNIPRASFVIFACFALIPVLVMAFILTYESLRDRWYMKTLFYASVVNFVMQQIFQITGVLYYMQMIAVVHLLLILIVVGLIAAFIEMKKQPEGKQDYFIYKAILILTFFGVADIIWFYLFTAGRVGGFIRVGILFFIAYLGYDTLRQIEELRLQEAKNSSYKELAFTDIMTGLDNRTSFTHTMEVIRKQNSGEDEEHGNLSWIIMMVDMNCLKKINDEYGHDKGDEAIFKLASYLKEYFGPVGQCFRIGGDEFCVLAPDIEPEHFEKICEEFRTAMKKEDTELAYPFSASMGYVPVDEKGVDECLKIADAKMYEEKRKTMPSRGR